MQESVMADMADFALDSVINMENLRDQYVSGDMGMEDAYDNGFIDEQGVEQGGIQDAWDRYEIPTKSNIDNQLRHAIKDFEISNFRSQSESIPKTCNPTCNVCKDEMLSRMGKFGKFYFCACTDQPTVSDSYWQKVR
jgi:hypothetical protein